MNGLTTQVEGLRNKFRTDAAFKLTLLAGAFLLACYYLGTQVNSRGWMIFLPIVTVTYMVVAYFHQEKAMLFAFFYSSMYLFMNEVFLRGSEKGTLLKEMFLIVVILFFTIDLIVGKRKMQETGLHKPMLVFGLILIAQAFNPNVYGLMSVLDDLRFWLPALGVFFLTTTYMRTEKQVHLFINVIFAYAVLESVYGIAQRFLPMTSLQRLGADPTSYFYIWEEENRVFSTMGTQHFAFFSVMMVPLALWKMKTSNDFMKRAFFFGTALLFLAGSAFTFVRSAWVSFLGALLLLYILSRKPIFILLLVGLVIFGLFIASGVLRERIEGIVNPSGDDSVKARLYTWKHLTEAVVFRVFGYGLGTFTHSKFTMRYAPKFIFGKATENFYLYLLMELGWFGFAAFLWILYKIYQFGYSTYRTMKNRDLAELALSILGITAVIDIGRLSGPSGYFVPESWHYWFFVGILFCLPRLDSQSIPAESAAEIPEPHSPLAGLDRRSSLPASGADLSGNGKDARDENQR